jgi:polar amino acid transport system substrate-binding protein
MKNLFSLTAMIPILAPMAILLWPNPGFCVSLQTIRDRGQLHIGIKTNLFPMGFHDEKDQLIGFEIEMAKQLGQEIMGQADAVKLIPVNNLDRLQAVADGKVDLAIASITATDSRRRWVDFTAPYYFERSQIVVQDPRIQSLRDLRGATVAVMKGSSAIEALNLDDLGLQWVEVSHYQEALTQLKSGQVKALAGDRVMLLGLMRQESSLYLLKEEFGLYPVGIAMPKGLESDSLRSAVNQAIERWQKNGWLRSQWIQWNLDR